MRWFRRREKRAETETTLEQVLLSIMSKEITVTKQQALNIPTVYACIDLISDTVAMLPVKLYRESEKKTEEVQDSRVELLNGDTGDTLDAYQLKKNMVTDYLMSGNAYAYINRKRNKVVSLNYVDEVFVGVNANVDPIFKNSDILVNGVSYRPYEFIKLARTKNGTSGTGVIQDSPLMLAVAFNSLKYENMLVGTGGNKKGFLKATNRLTKEVIDDLKAQWNNMYKNNLENVVVLNNGLEFQEASNTSVEMQLNEQKKTNAAEICKLFRVPPALLEGTATDAEYNVFVKIAILPVLKAFETALNRDLLLLSERESFYFAFDTKELLKGDIEKRFRAYEIASRNGIMQTDEIRYMEDLEPLGLDFIKLGLQDVLYNPKTKEIYTPNTNKTADMENPDKGGDEDENRNSIG